MGRLASERRAKLAAKLGEGRSALNAAYLADWEKSHPELTGLAPLDPPYVVAFFKGFSKQHPGALPGVVEHRAADGKMEKRDRAGA